MQIPASTYRIQLNQNFNFAKAEAALPYLHKLGVSWIYLSPIMTANPGSLHGYDVTNPNQISREAGGEAGFTAFSHSLKTLHMGLLIDFVPNHMAASANNPWWHDVIKRRDQSQYAAFFDISWDASNSEKISYRRFFDINELICLRMEDPAIFNATHPLLLQLIHNQQITGIRLDHIDGLKNPEAYLNLLANKISQPVYTVVEKILARNEHPPASWHIAGTTGYDFTNELNQIFVNPAGYLQLLNFYEKQTVLKYTIAEIRYHNNQLVIKRLFKNEFKHLIDFFAEIAKTEGHVFNKADIEKLLLEICARIPVYRTYIHNHSISPQDKNIITTILDSVEKKSIHPVCLTFFQNAVQGHLTPAANNLWLQWLEKWQVFTGPMVAKGYEDTTCYQFNPLLSLNEVGSEPLYFSAKTLGDLTLFHQYNQYKQSHYPYSLNATSTHDTKRSEDVRARLNVLTEIPDEWTQAATRWRQLNVAKKIIIHGQLAPDVNDELMLYQSMLGAWPLFPHQVSEFILRLHTFLTKALRESKVHSTWYQPNIDYEEATLAFCDALFTETADNHFLPDFIELQQKLAFFGMLNSLTQTAVKIVSPGIPDIYQGNEIWQFDLVDPDNRHVVDFNYLAELLDSLFDIELENNLLTAWTDGRIKLYLTYYLLNFRRNQAELFSQGKYIPLEVAGIKKQHVIAFARCYKNHWVFMIATRWCTGLCAVNQFPLGMEIWGDTQVILPPEAPRHWRSVLTETEVADGNFCLIGQLLNKFPVAIFHANEG